ncbi:hypothetical protein HYS84_02670 [Candidatus Saccharibacteria bacterium]|nr:hypothetical protein [Candidatus Saccharibacteria bacterium]
MRRAQKLQALILSVSYIFSLGLLNIGLAYADTKPYFQIHGADVFAGGWWFAKNAANGYNCDLTTNYQAPSFDPLDKQYKGGILAFNNGGAQGALSDFGALALGQIQGENGYGFASNRGNDKSKLSFANDSGNANGQGAAYWGGFFDAGARQLTHCIPDYYNLKSGDATDWGSSNLATAAAGKYKASAGPVFTVNSSAVTITKSAGPTGKTITLFVDGDAYIGGDIAYEGGYSADTVSKFTLVVRGSLYVDKAVKRLDGLYIAQPNMSKSAPASDDTGIIWTCSTATSNGPDDRYISQNCRNDSLVVNGALIAKQVNLLRLAGDVSNSTVAESFNYTPEVLVGGSNFYGTDSGEPHIDSLVSLPPVF